MNKILLFLVEGNTDETALALTLTRQLSKAKFHVIKTDVTSDECSTVDNIEEKIFEQISFFLAEHPEFVFDDIDCVIQLVDTDGAFISDEFIIEDKEQDSIVYKDDAIIIDDTSKISIRNKNKSNILNYLSNRKTLTHTDKNNNTVRLRYRIYYMSCNLEDVLHNKKNCSVEEKVDLAKTFRRKSATNKNELRDILFSPNIDNSTTYIESWDFIKKDKNSLHRKSNFSYFFREFIDDDVVD